MQRFCLEFLTCLPNTEGGCAWRSGREGRGGGAWAQPASPAGKVATTVPRALLHACTRTHAFSQTGAAVGRNGKKKRPSPTPALSTVTVENKSHLRDEKDRTQIPAKNNKKDGSG